MRGVLGTIHSRGAELVVVGSGSPAMARAFREDTGLTGPLLVDPSLASYRAAGMKYGVLATLGPRSLAHGLRAFRAGFRQGKTQGEAFQQGGVLVIAKGGEVRFAFASNEAGDHPSIESVLAALPA